MTFLFEETVAPGPYLACTIQNGASMPTARLPRCEKILPLMFTTHLPFPLAMDTYGTWITGLAPKSLAMVLKVP